MPIFSKSITILFILFSLFFPGNHSISAEKPLNPNTVCVKNESILVSDSTGKIILSINADQKLIPASILKLLTALTAFHYLGTDYRFPTEFYIDDNMNLKIKGYGDPLLTSKVIQEISGTLKRILPDAGSGIGDIILDDSYFADRIIIPGRSSSPEPYDAPNGALCVNFNTVFFKRAPNGSFVSAEPETPLLPFVLKRIKASGINNGRIVLSHFKKENRLYAGHMFQYFMAKQGIKIKGRVRPGRIAAEKDRLIFRYYSKFTMAQVVSKLLEFSNNFIANQILIAVGADTFGAPGTLEKGVKAMLAYSGEQLKAYNINISEGSGISRKNRMSARDMLKVVEAFKPYRNLMRHSGNEYFKTGTLKGVSTRAGYLLNQEGALFSFVIMINKQGMSAKKIMKKIRLLVEN
jgi:D-alanyl-D-alanine carboxypeptidase/D-alanyl-D-alanine-endopeptidase (penicillin-binding protein 4)